MEMPEPLICREVANALAVKEYIETSAIQNLLLRNPERYRNVICDRNQDAAQLALTFPANIQYQTQDPLREQQRIFRMFIEYSVYSGMSITEALDTVRTALNKFLDDL
ncbi:uncharacterized protein LOC124153003 [Haliotis rufescens]|uniref:uncharacterized protein LOC124153003 n=1 Tax=Haliotis rufescens TaxID=6454 RepID=UPI00201F035B|nr:uncharacterized protein LOC124153003 [Haliotis rufescens]